jgi:hypothetical protein
MGPPGEWSGAVAGTVSPEQRQDLLRAWRSMSAEERNTIVAKWRERFNAPADKTASEGRVTAGILHALGHAAAAERVAVGGQRAAAYLRSALLHEPSWQPAALKRPTEVIKRAGLPVSKEHREAARRVDTHFRSNDPKKWDTLMDNVQRKSFVAAVKQDTRADPKFERHVDQMGRLLTGKAIGKVGQYDIVRMRGGGIGCTCPDWRYKKSVASAGEQDCKHIAEWRATKGVKTAAALSPTTAKKVFAAGTALGLGALAVGLHRNAKSTQFTPAQKQMRSLAMHEVAGLGMLASPYAASLASAGAEALSGRPGRVGVAARAAHAVLEPLSHAMHGGEGHSTVLPHANELLGLGLLVRPSMQELHHLNSQMKKHGMAAVDRTEVLNDVGFHTRDNRYVTLTDKKYLSALADGHIKDNKVFKVPHDVQRLHERLYDQGLKLPHKDAAIYLRMEHAAAQTPGGNRIKVPGEAHAPVHLVGDHGVLRDLGNLTWSPDKKGRGILTTFRTPEMGLRTPLTGQAGRSTLLADVFSHEPKLMAEHKELRNAARRFLGASVKSL